MPETPRTNLEIRDFRGLVSNVDRTDLPAGFAAVQTNLNGFRRGQLEVRRGLRELLFDEDFDITGILPPSGDSGSGDPGSGGSSPPPDPPPPPPDDLPPPPPQPRLLDQTVDVTNPPAPFEPAPQYPADSYTQIQAMLDARLSPLVFPGLFGISQTLRLPVRTGYAFYGGGLSQRFPGAVGGASALIWLGPAGGTMLETKAYGVIWEGLSLWGVRDGDPNTNNYAGVGIRVTRPVENQPVGTGKYWISSIDIDSCDVGMQIGGPGVNCDNIVGGLWSFRNCTCCYKITNQQAMDHNIQHFRALSLRGDKVMIDVTGGGQVRLGYVLNVGTGNTLFRLADSIDIGSNNGQFTVHHYQQDVPQGGAPSDLKLLDDSTRGEVSVEFNRINLNADFNESSVWCKGRDTRVTFNNCADMRHLEGKLRFEHPLDGGGGLDPRLNQKHQLLINGCSNFSDVRTIPAMIHPSTQAGTLIARGVNNIQTVAAVDQFYNEDYTP